MSAVFGRIARLPFGESRQRIVRHVSNLDDYLLADIGIIRSEIHDVIARGRTPSALSSSPSKAA